MRVRVSPAAFNHLPFFMRETPERSIIEPAEPVYDHLHQLAEEEQLHERLHEDLHAEWHEAEASLRHTESKIRALCVMMGKGGTMDRERALDRVQQLYRIMETRRLQMEKIKADVVVLRAMEATLQEKLRVVSLEIMPQAKA